MPQLPTLALTRSTRSRGEDQVVFAVYAPLGTDPILSLYPNPNQPQAPIQKQPLVRYLQQVAAEGVNVSALIDLYLDDSYLVEIPAGKPQAMTITSAWKQDMSAPQALAGFLRRTHARFPCAHLVLALEGHGGAFVPDIDPQRITPSSLTQWKVGGQSGSVRWIIGNDATRYEGETGSPALPMASPSLPMASPSLPASRLPLSTWAMGEALRLATKAGVPKPAVIHFNNCFNASVELLHTVAPYAGHATGYANYDFFTAGSAYPGVFKQLRLAGSTTALQLARWFALANQAELAKQPGHPTLGAVVPLASLRKTVAPLLNTLAQALTAQLRGAARASVLARIKAAAIAAQHYDTVPGFELKVPDQFMDLGSFALQIKAQFADNPVNKAAGDLLAALATVKVYGDLGSPGMAQDPAVIYDFRARELGLNIFFPDPDLTGNWDWRSPYYLSGKVDPQHPPAHRHVIDFLADGPGGQRPAWVEFIDEYHKGTAFIGFLAVQPLFFPLFNPPRATTGPGKPPGPDKPPTTGPTRRSRK